MKTVSAAIAYFAALMAVCWFGAGCASLGDGRLEPVTKATAKAALTAAIGQDTSALSITPVEGGALAGVDVLAASDAVASDGWTGHEAKRAAVLTEKNDKAKLAGVAAALFGEVAK